MFEKARQNLQDYLKHQKNDLKNSTQKPSQNPWKDAAAGLAMLLIFLFLSYSLGLSNGRQNAISEIPELAKSEQRFDEISKFCSRDYESRNSTKTEAEFIAQQNGAAK